MDFQRNNLDRETSPYLGQHRGNPVHWQPWRSEVLAHARHSGKPILLSVGYAACHWCHVMAHESFEDEAIAAVMNALFVNIKVDREERPDIDTIYQGALQLLGQQGGWPLTMFLTPDGEPFWGGTYFPSTPRFGRPGFADVLKAVEGTFRRGQDKVEHNRRALAQAMARLADGAGAGTMPADIAETTASALLQAADMRHGGLGQAPKFPHVPDLELLWRAWRQGGDDRFGQAVLRAADAMAEGGIYDHLGGGWARYSVDERWLVPHFEKMLYDNAQLIEFYTRLHLATGKCLYRQRVTETVAWLEREMTATGGAFCSSLDADSDDGSGHSEEGAFYVWSEGEIDAALGDEAAFFKRHYDVTAGGNWEGKTILNRLAAGTPDDEAEARLATCRRRLAALRETRARPGLDDKVLADWNGLAIRALARAGAALGQLSWIAMARRAFDRIVATMSEGDRLCHSARGNRRLALAMLDDYSHMADAALALHEATGDDGLIGRARAWVACADAHYWDDARGGYFFTADDAEALILRSRTALDHATPSGNGTMLGVLARLWHLTGEDALRQRGEALAAAFAGDARASPAGHAVLIANLDLLNHGLQVTIVGQRGEQAVELLLAEVRKAGRQDVAVLVTGDGRAPAAGHPAAGKGRVDGQAAAYLCRGQTCSPPVTEAAALARLLAPAAR